MRKRKFIFLLNGRKNVIDKEQKIFKNVTDRN